MGTVMPAIGHWQRWRLLLDIWIAARFLPFRIRGKSFSEILRLAENGNQGDVPHLPVPDIARFVRKAVRNPILMRDRRCLRAGLVGYEYLRRAGYRPQLHFAVDEVSIGSPRISAHCWVSIDGEEVINNRMDGQVTIYVHPSQTGATEGQ